MTDLMIRIKAAGEKSVRRAMQGITRESEKSARKARRTTRDRVRQEHEAARDIIRTAKRAEERKRKEMERTMRDTRMNARERKRLEEKTERDILRIRQRAARQAQRSVNHARGAEARNRRRRRAGAVAGAAVGAAAGAFAESRRAQGVLGIESQDAIISRTINARQDFIRTARQAGFSQERQDEVFGEASRVSRSTGIGTQDILSGINLAQEQFANLDRLVPNLQFLAEVARSTGGEFSTIVQASGELERQFGLQGDELQEAIALISQGAEVGSLSLRDFAESQASGFSGFTTARGISGLEGVREFQAIAQGLRAGGLSSDEVRTRQTALTSTLSDSNVQARLGRAGVNVLDESGNLRGFDEIISGIAGSENLQTSSQLRSALGSQEAMQAVNILAAQQRAAESGQEGALSLSDRMNVSADAGREGLQETLRRLNADVSGEAVRMRAEREASIFENSERLIDAFTNIAGPLSSLENEFPLLTQAVTGLTTVLGGAGIGSIGGGLLGGAGAGGGIAAAGGMGASVGAAGLGTSAGVAVGGLAAGLGIGRGIGHLVDAVTGGENGSLVEDQNAALGSLVNGTLGSQLMDGLRFITGNETVTQAQPSDRANEENTRATSENTRATTEAARAMERAARAIGSAAASGADGGGAPPAGVE